MKIVINTCYGSPCLSGEAVQYLKVRNIYDYPEDRTDSEFVKCVEELGKSASGNNSNFQIIEIPDAATDWTIEDYDGMEYVLYVIDGKINYACK